MTDRPIDAAADPAAQNRELAAFWIEELTQYEKAFARWTTRVRKIVKKYRDERAESTEAGNQRRYCILWSNVETIRPAVYARPPKAVAQRRWKDRDSTGRVAALILERAANFSIDCYDLNATIKDCVTDYLLAGRGTAWARYQGDIESDTDDQGNVVEDLYSERVSRDFVNWDDFCHSVSRTWPEVWWVARRTYQSRKQLVDRFGKEAGDQVPLDWGPERNDATGQFEKRSKAAIYEIWSKRDNKVYFISRAFGRQPLLVREPNYKLTDFFPCPRPCYATMTPDCLIPVPDYVYYQDQAEEIDELTARIGKLTDALKLVGIYAGQEQAMLGQLLSPQTDMKMIAVENWAMLTDNKGIAGLIDWFPVDQVIKVLTGCIELRAQMIQDIYQITGISDIVRGATDAQETATAQQIKSQWGGLRVRDRQQEIQRFARDMIRIESEIAAQLYQPQTFAAMTGVQLPMQAEKDRAQAQIDQMRQIARQQQMLAQQQQSNGSRPPSQAGMAPGGVPPAAQGAPPVQPEVPPEIRRMLETPSWEDVLGLLRNNELRDFKIDVETDSTIQPDEDNEKQRRVELLDSVGSFFQKSIPLLQTVPALSPMIGELILFAVRGFRTGASVEDAVEEAMQNVLQAAQAPNEAPPDPALLKADADIKASQAKAESDMRLAEMHMRMKVQESEQLIAMKQVETKSQIEIANAKAVNDIALSNATASAKNQERREALRQSSAAKAAPAAAPQIIVVPTGGGPKRISVQCGDDGMITGATSVEDGVP